MKAEDFIAWLEVMGWTDAKARERLGIGSQHTIAKFKTAGTPLYIALACNALAKQLGPWTVVA